MQKYINFASYVILDTQYSWPKIIVLTTLLRKLKIYNADAAKCMISLFISDLFSLFFLAQILFLFLKIKLSCVLCYFVSCDCVGSNNLVFIGFLLYNVLVA